ncbi:MAG: YidC/Oxa1 family membrane protein insertase [Patescibacteria group bacterium]
MPDIFLQSVLFIYNTVGFQNLGIAIVEISVLTRIIFYPFLKQQTHYTKKMSELQPHLNALKDKHKDNKQVFAQAQMALFKEHGVNPAAGCLPAIVQIVILFGLFGALSKILNMNLNTSFFFWDMAKPDAYHLSGLPFAVPGVLVILAALTQYIQTKMMLPTPAPKPQENKNKKSDFTSDFADAQSSMVWMFPLMFLFLGTQWPSGLALYWTISSVLAIYQQYKVNHGQNKN